MTLCSGPSILQCFWSATIIAYQEYVTVPVLCTPFLELAVEGLPKSRCHHNVSVLNSG